MKGQVVIAFAADTANNRLRKLGVLEVGVDVTPGSDPNCFSQPTCRRRMR